MRDLLLFVNNLHVIGYFVRHVFVFLGLVLMLFALTLAWAEDWTLGAAAYFTLITGLTVGYGDITPVTPLGKIASVASAIVGIVATGLYVAIASKAVSTSIRGQRL
ncbi:MAG: potassium channel family protein, partial [Chromatiaceae bacterium]|nr:potassium channel family protein [Chromatiaceae bacterium]